MRRPVATALALALLGAVFLQPDARAQEAYPARPITIVVPFPAGGTSDILARSIGAKMQEYTGQTVVIENVSGAGTAIGAERVARAKPDGYTLLIVTSTTVSSNPSLYRKLRYKLADFAPVTLLTEHELAIHISPKIPAKSLPELIAYGAKKPGGLTYSSNGRGSISEVFGEMMKAAFKIDMRDVPYRGAAPALIDVMKGEIDVHADGITSTVPFLRAGTAKVIATTGRERSPVSPNIPTLIELGYKDLIMVNIYAMLAPAGTPRPVIDKINSLVHRALAEPQLRDRLAEQGAPPKPTTPEGLGEVMARDAAWFAKVVNDLKIPPVD